MRGSSLERPSDVGSTHKHTRNIRSIASSDSWTKSLPLLLLRLPPILSLLHTRLPFLIEGNPRSPRHPLSLRNRSARLLWSTPVEREWEHQEERIGGDEKRV